MLDLPVAEVVYAFVVYFGLCIWLFFVYTPIHEYHG